jgi:hypothetical protein
MASAVISRLSLVYTLFVSLPFVSFVSFLSILIYIQVPKMNDASLLAASAEKVQAAKKGVNLPNSLQDAAISDVIGENVVDKVTQEVILDEDGNPISTAFSIPGVPFSFSLKVDQIRMLCSKWNLKKYRGMSRDKLCLLIAQNQQLMVVYAA